MKQHTLKPNPGTRKDRKRLGRGGSHGTYAGKGIKGQKARTGGKVRIGFEGGQMPLLMRMPKLKGFKNPSKMVYFPVNLNLLDRLFEDGAKVDAAALVKMGVTKKEMILKLLGTGDLKKKLSISVDAASESAIKKVEKAGGKVTLLAQKNASEPAEDHA